MVRVSSPAKLRPWSELTAKMVMGVVPGLVTFRNIQKSFPGSCFRTHMWSECTPSGVLPDEIQAEIMYAPPPSPHFWPKRPFSREGGGGVYFEVPTRQEFYTPPPPPCYWGEIGPVSKLCWCISSGGWGHGLWGFKFAEIPGHNEAHWSVKTLVTRHQRRNACEVRRELQIQQYHQSCAQPGFRAEKIKGAISGHFLLIFMCLGKKKVRWPILGSSTWTSFGN